MNLTPYQSKRGKQFKPETTSLDAVEYELFKFWKTEFPVINENLNNSAPLKSSIVTQIANVSSPAIVNDTTLPWTSIRLTSLLEALLILEEIQKEGTQKLPKKRIDYLPKPYRKYIKRLYTSIETRDRLAKVLKSNKAAKKELRILHKRLGLYVKRKPPFQRVK